MRKFKILFIVAFCVPFAFGFFVTQKGTMIQPTFLATPMSLWQSIGTITATQATLAVGARDYSAVQALVDANSAKWDVENDDSGVFFAFECTGDANSYVTEVWVAASPSTVATYSDRSTEDHYTLGAILTLTGGTQVSGTGTFVDTISVTSSTGVLADAITVLDSGNNRIAMVRMDFQGWKSAVFINTTHEAGTTLKPIKRSY